MIGGEMPGNPLQLAGDFAQLTNRPLQVRLAPRRVAGLLGQRIGLFPRALRHHGNALDLARERIHLAPLLRRRLGNAARMLPRLAGGVADRIKRGGGVGAQMLAYALDLPTVFITLANDLLTQAYRSRRNWLPDR